MKYLAIFLGFMACNSTPTTLTQSGSSDGSANQITLDSLVPARYDDAHHLIRIRKSDAEWKKELSAQAYYVLREAGTERAFTGAYWDNHKHGTYVCAACGLPLFSSETKFESGTGWPSFWQSLKPEYVVVNKDTSHGMLRDEVECGRCGGHLGHVFDDGPRPTGLRYCMNSVSMSFIPN